MKKLKILFGFVFAFSIAFIFNSMKCYAAEVRYTENIIPQMTSDTTPSGKASASNVWKATGNYGPAYLAFDRISDNEHYAWATVSGVWSGWLSYEFADKKCITKYTIISRNPVYSLKELPKDWTFEAWDDQKGAWVILDTHENMTDWAVGIKKEFTFTNTNYYNKYRINVIANANSNISLVIGDVEMMETIPSPKNLIATAGDSFVKLTWDPVANASGYNIKRSNVPYGPYDTIASSLPASTVTYTDTIVNNNNTYYYIVSAIISGLESSDSNEVSATPIEIGNAILSIILDNGTIKEYDLNISELNSFLTWYDNITYGIERGYYIFSVKESVNPFISIKNYIPYSKILYFDIKEYSN
jgi:hypothetical protein